MGNRVGSRGRAWLGWGLCVLVAAGCAGTQTTGERRDPGAVAFDGALGNRFVPAGERADIVSRLRVGTLPLPGGHRPPINLALVVDTSGSMEGQPIADARAATEQLLSALAEGDRLAVVAFHSETEVLLPSTRIEGGHLDELRQRIAHMEARGTTDLAGGLRAGLEEVVRYHDPSGINRLILLSDGVPNDRGSIEALAQAAGERGVAITALGLGLDYDETLLGAIAQRSGGRFHFVESSSAVATVFRDEVLHLSRIIARNVVIELRPGPGVTIESVVGVSMATGTGGVRVTLGDVSEGDTRDVVVRMSADARRSGARLELVDAILSFDDAIDGAGRFERRVYLGARATDDPSELASGRDEQVELDAARASAAAVTIEAIRMARGGEIDQARAMLAQAAAQTEVYAYDDAASSQASSMRVLSTALPAIASDAPPPESARAVREAHDEATSVLQGY